MSHVEVADSQIDSPSTRSILALATACSNLGTAAPFGDVALCVSIAIAAAHGHWSIAIATCTVLAFFCMRHFFGDSSCRKSKLQVQRQQQHLVKHKDVPKSPIEELEALWAAKLVSLPSACRNLNVRGTSIDWDVEGSDMHLKELSDVSKSDMSRFLAARGNNAANASQLAESVCQWRAAVQPATVAPHQMRVPLAQGMYRISGWTKCGYPVIVLDSKRWRASECTSVDEFVRYIGYFHEIVCKAWMGEGVHRFVMVVDLNGFSSEMVRPFAMKCVVQLAKCLGEINAERCASIFLINVPRIFHMSWNLFSCLADEKTLRKIRWCSQARTQEVLGRFIDASVLERLYGGDHVGWRVPSGVWKEDVPSRTPPCYDCAVPDPMEDH